MRNLWWESKQVPLHHLNFSKMFRWKIEFKYCMKARKIFSKCRGNLTKIKIKLTWSSKVTSIRETALTLEPGDIIISSTNVSYKFLKGRGNF